MADYAGWTDLSARWRDPSFPARSAPLSQPRRPHAHRGLVGRQSSTPIAGVTIDQLGNPRLAGNAPDIGAVEKSV